MNVLVTEENLFVKHLKQRLKSHGDGKWNLNSLKLN